MRKSVRKYGFLNDGRSIYSVSSPGFASPPQTHPSRKTLSLSRNLLKVVIAVVVVVVVAACLGFAYPQGTSSEDSSHEACCGGVSKQIINDVTYRVHATPSARPRHAHLGRRGKVRVGEDGVCNVS